MSVFHCGLWMSYHGSMFLFRENGGSGPWFVSQNSHAWMAWQLAGHWGNRRFSRAAPRAETLAAVLLHEAGWRDYDRDPELDNGGCIRSSGKMVVRTQIGIWRKSVSIAEDSSRYAAFLVAASCARIAARKSAELIEAGALEDAGKLHAFAAEMEGLQAGWKEVLSVDPRYDLCLEGPGLETNSMILEVCSRLAAHLCAASDDEVEISAPEPGGGNRPFRVRKLDSRSYSLSPWPMEGRRLKVHCELRRLRSGVFSSRAACRKALESAPRQRLGMELVAPSRAGR